MLSLVTFCLTFGILVVAEFLRMSVAVKQIILGREDGKYVTQYSFGRKSKKRQEKMSSEQPKDELVKL